MVSLGFLLFCLSFFFSFVFSFSPSALVVTQQSVHIVRIVVPQLCNYELMYGRTAGAKHYEAVGVQHCNYSVVFVFEAFDLSRLCCFRCCAVPAPLHTPHATLALGSHAPMCCPGSSDIFIYGLRDDYICGALWASLRIYLRIDDSTVSWGAYYSCAEMCLRPLIFFALQSSAGFLRS